jgi:uncharacterized protein YndB with AHSA1/START domain
MAAARFVAETYIKAAPERIWHALTDSSRTERFFFGCRFVGSLEPGGEYLMAGPDGTPAIRGSVVEFDPPRRLSLSFVALWDETSAIEVPSSVTWEITPAGAASRLTLVHGDLGRSPQTWAITHTGWPIVLAGLKTVVETGEALGEIPMLDTPPSAAEVDVAWHRSQAVDANNGAYTLLADMPAGADRAVHHAHAAAYHWRIAGSAPEWAMAEYLCSRVYAYAGRAEPALHHADRCAALAADAALDDWRLAFAHEAMARALACSGDLAAAGRHLAACRAVAIADPEDAAIVAADLADGPWFGLDVSPT